MKDEPKKGLINVVDNSSYLNAVLQFLCHIKDLCYYFLDKDNKKYLEDNIKQHLLSFVTERLLTHLYRPPEKKENDNYNPKSYFRVLSALNVVYKNITKKNPNDLLIFILNKLHEELNSEKTKEQKNYNSSDIQNISIYKENYYNNNKSIISDVFNFFRINKFTCLNCAKQEYKCNSFLTFELDILNTYNMNNVNKENYSTNIKDCLNYQLLDQKKESLYCSYCQKAGVNKKELSYIFMAPKVFIFLINRGINFDKANRLITIPFEVEEIINIEHYNNLLNKEIKEYELTGIVSISLKEEKYICFCKSFINNKWYEYNDTNIKENNISNIINENSDNNQFIPCLLYYKLKN